MQQFGRIGVLMGGMGPERAVSLETGAAVAEALRSRGHEVVEVYVDRDVDRVLRQQPIDVAFLALHGPYGEDGCIQGMLELMGIPYTGSGVLASALAMDKVKAKEAFRLYNVPTPPSYEVVEADLDRLEAMHGSFGFPVFVKPRHGGSSVGAGRADDFGSLRLRCEEALRDDEGALVERLVMGREVAVAILDGRALGAVEIEPTGPFYDYRSKYQQGGSRYHIPPRLGPTRYTGLLRLAERAHQAVGARGASRVDLLVTDEHNEYVLEVNTLPGMTPTSLLPKIARASGIDFESLCEAILVRATLDRPALRSRTSTSRPAARPIESIAASLPADASVSSH